ncbi:NACHT domain-containing NTPase [Klebsiella oxytoca]|uniref:NACHT domain-containing NTPase n=1 Tax=Klebsiella oxytoca TaxID=571 RepID=UPI0034D2DDEC
MTTSYDLTQLDSYSFEHMVNFLAMKKLGNGITGFAAGPDGGRDGYLRGKAPYPTTEECWEGMWYIQSKFHKPNLSTNSQKWLIREIVKEIRSYSDNPQRKLPDIWIIATNIEPSGQPHTGAYDKIISLVRKYASKIKVDVWGGRKILDFLMEYPMVAQAYGHFLTPGHIISALYKSLEKEDNKRKSLIEHFMVSQFKDLSYTKLEQAGSNNDHKPKIHELFRDLPIMANSDENEFFILQSLVSSSCNVQKISTWLNFGEEWKDWTKNPRRTRVMLLKGGPGQGKSTVGQYFSQIQRAAYILSDAQPTITPLVRDIARELKKFAEKDGFWPSVPRIPIFIELKDYANWYINKDKFSPRNLIEYICYKVNLKISFIIDSFDLRTVFSQSTWFINFDGLDEVPNDLKDDIANEVISFSNEFLPSLDSDALILCTTRPQGYSGQFDELDASVCNLTPLPKEIALSCAEPVVRFGRSEEDGDNSLKILEASMMSPQVKEIMTTPLQSHIMAVVVRDGGKPPEKRWELFNNFYTVMKKREILKNFADANIASLLQEKDILLKAIHDRLGICLHVRAEYSPGAEASLPKEEFRKLATSTTEILMDGNIEETVITLMEATTERLVFVNTPDSTDYVRFDIRQLQEFFAAEFIHNDVSDQILIERLSVIIGDAHWREVVHFVLSALIHYKKKTALMLVAKILQQLDTDDDNHKIRFFKRKSGIGALLVLRLVEEGMLEQDKRVRALFSDCLMPLWINTEQSIINRIIKLQMNQSKNWILYNMIESFLSMDHIETISCPFLFSSMIDTSHERFDDMYAKLLSMPDDCLLISFLTANAEYHHYLGSLIKPWFIEFAVAKYFSEETSYILLSSINIFLSRYFSIGQNKIELLNLDERYKEYLHEFFVKPGRASHEDMPESSNYCFITPVPFDLDWKSCNSFPLSATKFNDKIYSFPVELFKALDMYFTVRNTSSFRRILKLIIENKYKLACIPSTLQAFVPLCFDNSIFQHQVNTLYDGDDDYLDTYLSTKIFEGKSIGPDSKYVVFNHESFSGEKWKELCSDFPDLALNVITAQFVDGQLKGDVVLKENKNIHMPILNIAKKYPHIFSSYYFLWGGLFNAFPSEVPHLKALMVKDNLPVRYKSISNINMMSIYKLNLPDDKQLIVHLANALASSKTQLDKYKKGCPEYFTNGVLEAFGLNFETIYKIATNIKEEYLLRVSSLSLLLHHQLNDKASTIDYFFEYHLDDLCIELYSASHGQLVSNPLLTLLHDVVNIDAKLQEFVGRYSIVSRNDFSSLTSMQLIISKWRERSTSVVHNSGKLEHWLTE